MRSICLAVLVVIGALALLSLDGCSRARDPAPVVYRTVGGVEGIELRHSGFGRARRHPGHFSLGYAIWANYPFLLYRGEVYRRAGTGGVIIVPADGISARYLVEETALEPEGGYGSPPSELVIVDRTGRQVLGHRILREGQTEDRHGWTGQHAAEFVRKVLQTGAPIGGAVGTKPYGRAAATFEVLTGENTPPAGETGADCPVAYRLDKERPSIGLDTGTWVFVPQSHINSFACQGSYILTQSGYASRLYLDLLTKDGRHVFQTELHLPVDVNAQIAIRRLRLEQTGFGNTEMQVDVFYGASRDRDDRSVAAQQFRATIQLPPAAVARRPGAG